MRTADPQHCGTVRGQLLAVQHLPDDVLPDYRVPEVVPLCPRDQQPPLGEQPQVCHVATRALDGVLQDLVRDVLPEDRRHVQRETSLVRQLVDGTHECLSKGLGVGALDPLVGGQLQGDERVAVAQVDHGFVLLDGQLNVRRGQELPHLVCAQRLELDVAAHPGTTIADGPTRARLPGDGVIPAGEQEEQSFLPGSAGQEVEQVETGRVGPVDVLHEDQHRLALGDLAQGPQHAREQPRPLQPDVRRRDTRRRCGNGHHRPQQVPHRAGRPFGGARRRTDLTQHLDEGPEGQLTPTDRCAVANGNEHA